MELVCDRNVADKYYRAFQQADWITVRRVRDVLSVTAPDTTIIDIARNRGWVVFTADVRFLATDEAGAAGRGTETSTAAGGIVFYRQQEDPSPGDVIAALRTIARSYDDYSEIREYVPGDWL